MDTPANDDDRPVRREDEETVEVGHDAQVAEFRDALRSALNAVNVEIKAAGGKPQTGAVLTALIEVQADFIAMFPNRIDRRIAIGRMREDLPRLVQARLEQPAVKPAPNGGGRVQ